MLRPASSAGSRSSTLRSSASNADLKCWAVSDDPDGQHAQSPPSQSRQTRMLPRNASSIKELMGSGSARPAPTSRSRLPSWLSVRSAARADAPPRFFDEPRRRGLRQSWEPSLPDQGAPATTSRPLSVSMGKRLSCWAAGCPDLTANIRTIPSTSSRLPAKVSASMRLGRPIERHRW